MALPAVGQAKMIADQLERLIHWHGPNSIAVIGCAGGNGLDRIESTCVQRVVAVDINASYIATAGMRYANRLADLDLRCADVQCESLQFDPVDMIYAALIFEYVELDATLATLKRNLRQGGTLATLLQLPHSDQQAVSKSPYESLKKLAAAMRLIEPDLLCTRAAAAGFAAVSAEAIELPSGKQFWLQLFHHG